jgi:hypothetical protein
LQVVIVFFKLLPGNRHYRALASVIKNERHKKLKSQTLVADLQHGTSACIVEVLRIVNEGMCDLFLTLRFAVRPTCETKSVTTQQP